MCFISDILKWDKDSVLKTELERVFLSMTVLGKRKIGSVIQIQS